MKPILTAATLVAGIGVTTTSTSATDPQQDVASKATRGVINGIILGGKVGPDLYGFVPANIESRVTASGYTPAQVTAGKRPGKFRPPFRYAVPRRPQDGDG